MFTFPSNLYDNHNLDLMYSRQRCSMAEPEIYPPRLLPRRARRTCSRSTIDDCFYKFMVLEGICEKLAIQRLHKLYRGHAFERAEMATNEECSVAPGRDGRGYRSGGRDCFTEIPG